MASACATSSVPTGSRVRSGDRAEVARALARGHAVPAGPRNETGRPIVVAQLGRGADAELIAFDLDASRTLWRRSAPIAGRVVIGRAVILHAQPDGALVARDLRSGVESWRQPLEAGWARVAFAAADDLVYEVLDPIAARGGDRKDGAVVARAAGSGRVRWRRALAGPLGGVAAWGGLVAVLRQSQFVTLLDERGAFAAEVLSREVAANFVVAQPDGLFYGSRGVFRLGPDTAGGERSSPGYLAAQVPAFVHPLYERDMYDPAQEGPTALDRNHVLWRAASTASGGSAFADGLVVAHAFRFFFGLAARSGELRWAYAQPRVDAMAAAHTGPAIVFIAADGEIGALDALTGRRVYTSSIGADGVAPVEGATFDADGFAGGAPGPAVRLGATLAAIAWDPDRRLPEVKAYAVEALARAPGPEASGALLKALDGGDGLPGEITEKALEALVKRQDRSLLPAYLEALRAHADFTESRGPKRIDVLARAIGALKAQEAIPALVEHLRLPETDPAFVRDIADAALACGARDAVPAFVDYLAQYHADPDVPASAVEAACDVLIALGGPAERKLLAAVAQDPKTLGAVSAHLARRLEPDAPAP